MENVKIVQWMVALVGCVFVALFAFVSLFSDPPIIFFTVFSLSYRPPIRGGGRSFVRLVLMFCF